MAGEGEWHPPRDGPGGKIDGRFPRGWQKSVLYYRIFPKKKTVLGVPEVSP